MRTSKPIATISYNTQEYLFYKLEELIKSHKISDYMFINHFAEEDERKNHIHLWIKPNTLIDTMDLQKHFIENNSEDITKPLKCIDFRVSNIDDWILYGLHLEPYLASKGETRQYHYIKDDIIYHDEDTFEDSYNHALRGSEWAKNNQILQQLNEGQINPTNLIMTGILPLNMASQINSYLYMKTHYGTERGGRKNHEDD